MNGFVLMTKELREHLGRELFSTIMEDNLLQLNMILNKWKL